MENPIVFISYSWDNESHKNWVLDLANQLRHNGVDVILDRYYLSPGKNLHYFVENSLKICHKVLIVLTPAYKKKAEQRTGGVGHEYSLINNHLVKNISENQKAIPILRSGHKEESIPDFLQQYIYLDFSNEESYLSRFNELLSGIFEEPEVNVAPLGNIPDFKNLSKTTMPKGNHKIKILKSHIIIDMLDIKGENVTYHKNLKLIVVGDEYSEYKEDFGVDEGYVKEITFSPGSIKKKVQIDGRNTYEVTLNKIYQKGDTLEMNLNAHLINTFIEEEEHWTVISKYICDELEIEVRFPFNRKYKTFEGVEIDAHEQKLHSNQPEPIESDSGSRLIWKIQNPQLNHMYRFNWTW